MKTPFRLSYIYLFIQLLVTNRNERYETTFSNLFEKKNKVLN